MKPCTQDSRFGVRVGAVLGAICLVAATTAARADPIAEYFFWDRMGQAGASAVRNLQDYRAERQLWRDKISAARQEMDRCGGCSSARAELDKWTKIENQFHAVAGPLAASVGMPGIVADWLDIDVPLAIGRTPEDRERECSLNRPAWAEQAPEYCQQAVDDYLGCAREYEAKNGQCSGLVSKEVGYPCWDKVKLVRFCGAGNRAGFDAEKAAQELRRADPSVPEYFSNDKVRTVLYSNAAADFAPPMPPRDVLLPLFQSGEVEMFFLLAPRDGVGPLRRAEIGPFHPTLVQGENVCFVPNRRQDEMTTRICDDISSVWNDEARPPMLSCWYSLKTVRDTPEAVFWYGERPEVAGLERLLERSRNHPLLLDSRDACPASVEEARAASSAFRSRLSSLGVAQAPESVALPPPAWIRERDGKRAAQLAAFPLEGNYQRTSYQNERAQPSDTCTMRRVSEDSLAVSCTGRYSTWDGVARIDNWTLVMELEGQYPIIFTVSQYKEDQLVGHLKGVPDTKFFQTFKRIGDLTARAVTNKE